MDRPQPRERRTRSALWHLGRRSACGWVHRRTVELDCPPFVEPEPLGVRDMRVLIHELDQCLLEQVPSSIEQRYGDF